MATSLPLQPAGVPPTERRRYQRFTHRLGVHYHCLKSKENFRLVESVTKNISAGGLAMRSEVSVKKGQLIMLTLFVPAKKPATGTVVKGQYQRVFFLSRVVWENPVAENCFEQGVEFLDVAEEDRRKLNEYLTSCAPA